MARNSAPEGIESLMAALKSELHPRAYELVQGFLEVGERRLAIEHLCELLCEDEVVLDASTYRQLMDVVAELSLEERFQRIVRVPPGFGPGGGS